MPEKIKIGLIKRSEDSSYEINYKTLIERNGCDIITFFPEMSRTKILLGLEKIDGLVIPGGADLCPENYCGAGEISEAVKFTETPVNPKLDELEWRLFEKAREMSIPVFGICRGFQLINVCLGGTLYHDLPARFGSGVKHRSDEFEDASVPRRKPVFHEIKIERETSLYYLLGSEKIIINSFHHQGVHKLARGLRPLARSNDGLIEAFENIEGPYIFAVEFHPEKHCPEGDLFIKKFIGDIEALRCR